MKIFVRDIPRDGLDINEECTAAEIGLEPVDVDLKSKLKIQSLVQRVDNTVLVHSKVIATVGYFCARCLENFERQETQQFDFDYEVTPGLETIDWSEDVRQEMLLTHQDRILCRADCKGICPKCGVNLNTEKCKCH